MSDTVEDFNDVEMNEIVETNGSNSQIESFNYEKHAETENLLESEEVLDGAGDEEPHVKLTNLPLARVRKIVKTDPDINLVNQEAIFLITKATVSILEDLTKTQFIFILLKEFLIFIVYILYFIEFLLHN